MDSIKNSTTSVSAVNGYGIVSYRTFSATAAVESPNSRAAELDGLRCVEARLREAKRLVFVDKPKQLLWLFEPGTNPPALDHGSLQSQLLNGLTVAAQSEGDLKAAELARFTGRPPVSQPGHQHTSSASNSRAIQAANARAFQGNQHAIGASANPVDASRQHDALSVYEAFMSAVIGSISYNLSRFHHMIPLNYRTFVSNPRAASLAARAAGGDHDDDDDDDSTILAGLGCLLTTLDAHLSTAGTLVISTSVSTTNNVYQLEKILSLYDVHDDFLGELVRIAPSGMIARYVGHETSAVGSERHGSGPTRRSRAIQQWKTDTLRWLRMKGLILPDMNEEGKWVRVQLQPSQQAPKDLNDPSASLCRECLWPAGLCFLYSAGGVDGNLESIEDFYPAGHRDDQDPGVMWWQGPGQNGFTDPLWQAFNWFLGKPEREKSINARKKARQAQEDNPQPASEPTIAYPSSPLYSRGSAYGDLQAVSGVYPTPPDAVLPPGTSGHTNMEGIVTNQVAQDSQSQAGHTGLGGDTFTQQEHTGATDDTPGEHVDQSRPGDTPNGGAAEADNNDDLFEDMDEEMFGANDVTEADFNFFDDGDGGFGDLMDVSQPTAYEDQKQNNSPEHTRFEGVSAMIHVEDVGHAEGEPSTLKSEIATSPAAPEIDVQMAEIDEQLRAEDTIQDEELESNEASHEEAEEAVVREPSPPLSPAQINQKLFGSPHVGESKAEAQDFAKEKTEGGAMFDTVDFSQKMQLADSKYAAGGQFFFSGKGRNPNARPQSGQLSRPTSSAHSASLERTSNLIRSIVVPMGTGDDAHMKDSLSEDSDSYSDISVSTGSYDEDTGSTMLQDSGLLVPSHKKLGSSTAGTPVVGTPGTLQLDPSSQDVHLGDADGLMPELPTLSSLDPTPSDWSLASLPPPMFKARRRYGADAKSRRGSFSLASAASTPSSDGRSEAVVDAPTLNLKEIINITQMLADQIIHSTLDLITEDGHSDQVSSQNQSGGARKLTPIQTVQNAVKDLFQQTSECDMLKYASIQDAMPESAAAKQAQQKSVQRRATTADPHANMFFPISTPHVRLRRGEDTWDVLPPALSFWESLGLSPTSGPKNVMAYCVHPASEQLSDPIASFLDNISMAYESSKFGTHVRGPDIEHVSSGGLVPASVNTHESDNWKPTTQNCLQSIRDTCSALGRHLSRIDFKKVAKPEDSSQPDAVVVYLVNPFSDPHNLWQLCSAFWALFQAYLPSPSSRVLDDSKPELVLQLIPVKCIASFEAPVVLEPSLLARLAREVYDRCPPKELSADHTALNIYSAPSIQLEETLPKQIPFRVTAEPPSDLLHENSYIHVGYAVSVDGSWLTVAWTDNPGKHQATASYCLNNRSFVDVAREIHQTSLEIMSARRVTWRLCIARVGVMEREEQEAWQALVTSPCSLVIGTALISVDPNPPFCMTSSLPTLASTTNQNSGTTGVSTPGGSTPQPGVSPDAHGAATPSDGNTSAPAADPSTDPDARLVDVTDESWGVILQHRLHNSNSTTEFRPALASGYLVKRGADGNTATATTESGIGSGGSGKPDHPEAPPRGPIAVGVNLLWIGSTAGGHQPQRSAAVLAAAAAAAASAAASAAAAVQALTPVPHHHVSSASHNPNISIPLAHLEAAAAAASSANNANNGANGAAASSNSNNNTASTSGNAAANSALPSPGTGGGGGTSSSSTAAGSASSSQQQQQQQHQQQQSQQQQQAGGGGGGGAAGPAAMGVGGSPFAANQARTTYDTVLREFLITYRGLGLLARLKGMRGTRGGAVPWHVAAAMRGVEAFERCL